jgi:hypothetical protein
VNALLGPVLLLLGFFAGSLVGTQVIRWGLLLWVSTTTHGGDFLGPPKRRLLWVFPFALLLHPTPYLVVFLLVFTVWTLQGKVGSIAPWLLGGFYLYIALVGLKILHLYRLRRRRRHVAGPNNRWSGRDA